MASIQTLLANGPAWLPTAAVVAAVAATAVYAVYRMALPTPLAGIPYDKESANRFMGDIPNFTKEPRIRDFWKNHAIKFNSPVVQYFQGPFAKPAVVVADFRETVDINLRRGKNIIKGNLQHDGWHGVLPQHFIGKEEKDPEYKEIKNLSRDLMTHSFLEEVSAPASYYKVVNFMNLWKLKAGLAKGKAFNAFDDLANLTFDIMMAAALNIDNDESVIVKYHKEVEASNGYTLSPDNSELAEFVKPEMHALLDCLYTICSAVGGAFTVPSQKLYHLFNNRRAPMKRAYKTKEEFLGRFIQESSQRLAQEGPNFVQKSAVDHMVAREAQIAKKAGREPRFDGLRINDNLFGYIVGGQDSTHSTLSFMVKFLGEEQAVQKKLRGIIRQAYPEAYAAKRPLTLQEITQTHIPYLEAFIEEVLCMQSPAVASMRESTEDMIVLGHFIPKGTPMAFTFTGPGYSVPGFQVDESKRSETSQKHADDGLGDWAQGTWPGEEFHPERWLKPDAQDASSEVFDGKAGPMLTFASGNRACWGKRLAYLELKMMTTLFLWDLDFQKLPASLHDWDVYDELFSKPYTCRVKLGNAWDV